MSDLLSLEGLQAVARAIGFDVQPPADSYLQEHGYWHAFNAFGLPVFTGTLAEIADYLHGRSCAGHDPGAPRKAGNYD